MTAFTGNDRGLIPGPIWPWLASFTPTAEAENEATVVSFGTPLTRMRWATRPWLWPWWASSRVARSGETLNSVAFGCISLHSLSSARGLAWGFTLILTFSPQGRRDLTAFHGNDVCEQCSNQQGYGVSSSCRWFCIALPNPLLDRLLVPAALVHCWCMARTNIDIDDQACAEVMRRYRLATKREAINFALRTLAAEPASLDEARALRGIGWEGDLAGAPQRVMPCARWHRRKRRRWQI